MNLPAFFQSLLRRKAPAAMQELPSVVDSFIGRTGRALTPLRATGIVEVDGQRIEVFCPTGFLPQDCLVRITGRRLSTWLVEKL